MVNKPVVLDPLGNALLAAGLRPPSGPAIAPVPKPLSGLGFHPLALWDLRRQIGPHPDIMKFYTHFYHSDIAWLATGASNDDDHLFPSKHGFRPELRALFEATGREEGGQARRELRDAVKELIWDLATMLDRSMGGTTFVLHIDGATQPNTPARPEYLTIDTHIPPGFLADNPDAHVPIARMVQLFAEAVGVPTVKAYTQNYRKAWPRSKSTSQGRSANPVSTRLIPAPYPLSSTSYTFLGQKSGSLGLAPEPIEIPDDSQEVLELRAKLRQAEETIRSLTRQLCVFRNDAADAAMAALPMPNHSRTHHAQSTATTTTTANNPLAAKSPSRSRTQQPPIRASPPPYMPGNTQQTDLESLIGLLGLSQHAAVIRVIVNEPTFHPASWHQRLVAANVPVDSVNTLLSLFV